MSGHTPGPWEAKRLVDNYGTPYATNYLAHVDIGPCMIWCPVGNAEQEANARLIAAAPELYEAARLAIDALDLFMGDSDLYEDDTPEFLAMQALSAAIAKAEGRS